MRSLLSKVYYTVRNEGFGSVADRTARYLAYRFKRARVDKSETLAEWKALKDRYEGERAFLIGNGPSLNRTPLYLLVDEHTIAFNRFDLMLERITWTPDFYAVTDDRVLADTVDEANAMARRVDHAFFPDIHPYNIDFRDRIEKRGNVHWLFLDTTRFSIDLPYCGINKTVANVGLQILGHLGFKEIYMIGVDMDYGIPPNSEIHSARDITATEDNDPNHFDPRYFGKGRKYHVPMLDETFAKFREARRFFEARGIKVFNATKGGKLEEFPRVELEEVLGLKQEAVREAFIDNVRQVLGPDQDIDVNAALAMPAVPAGREIGPGTPVFRTAVEDAQRRIASDIHEYLPFGPFNGSYLFVSRNSGNADSRDLPGGGHR